MTAFVNVKKPLLNVKKTTKHNGKHGTYVKMKLTVGFLVWAPGGTSRQQRCRSSGGSNLVGFPFFGCEAPPSLFVQMTKVDKKSWRKEVSNGVWVQIEPPPLLNQCYEIQSTYPETWGRDRCAGSMRSWWRCRWLLAGGYWRVWSRQRWGWTEPQQQLRGGRSEYVSILILLINKVNLKKVPWRPLPV